MWNYERIKQEAKNYGDRVGDYLVLGPMNDPFYFGQPAMRKKAEWCAACFHEMGYGQPGQKVHLRRMHYSFSSRKFPYPKGTKLPPKHAPSYDADEWSWEYLSEASKAARWLGLIPFDSFEDARNEAVRPYALMVSAPTVETDAYELENLPLPDYRLANFSEAQPYHVELWAEKSTMDDILDPLARRYSINYQAGTGEGSITGAHELLQRIRRSGKPGRILTISDFDPSGQAMPVSTGRKLQRLLQDEGMAQDVRLIPVLLTYEQTQQHQLPRTERGDYKPTWVRRYGPGGCELDALEALRPGQFERIVRTAIETYYDSDLMVRTYLARGRYTRALESLRQQVLDTYQEEIEQLQSDFARVQSTYDALSRRVQTDLEAALKGRRMLRRPQAQPLQEPDTALFDSSRSYLEQVAVFKQFQGKNQQDEGAA